MKAPRIPSLFKNNHPKEFNFKPRYYIPKKLKRKKILAQHKLSTYQDDSRSKDEYQKGRIYKITLLIIILSLFFYKIIN